jgi:hypothetical protein
MVDWLNSLSPVQLLLVTVATVFGLSVVAALLGVILVRLGMHRPKVLARASALSESALRLVKRPLTIVVLDEVMVVLQTGHYTRNISDALVENHDDLKALIAEKVRADPNVRLIGRLPGYDTMISQVTETMLRVVVDMLGDPRMDELISDLLRNNIEQIKQAVRERAPDRVSPPDPPDRAPQTASAR